MGVQSVTMLPLTLLVLPCLLLLPHAQGELCTDQVEELNMKMEAMREEMKEEIEAIRSQIKVEITDEIRREFEEMFVQKETVLKAEIKKEMEAEINVEKRKYDTKEAAMKIEIENLQNKVSVLIMKAEKQEEVMKHELGSVQTSLTTAVSQLRDLPYVMVCSYQDYWDTDSSTITYDSILSEYNNADKPDGGDGKMDITTGQFTCLTSGYYTINYSGRARVHSGEAVYVYIYHNGEKVEESQWNSYIGVFGATVTGVTMDDQGSKTVILHLAVGDTVELKTGTCDGRIYHLTFCLSLTGFDY